MGLDNALAHARALEESLTLFWRYLDHDTHPTHIAETLLPRQVGDRPDLYRGHGLPDLSQLQELDERLSRISSQSQNLHNIFLSQDRVLPDDILSLILEQACVVGTKPHPSPWEHSSTSYDLSLFSVSTALALSGVCGRWRSLLLSNPVVWSDVQMKVRKPENLLWLEACLTRSASSSAGCLIHIDQSLVTPRKLDITRPISLHPSNIRYLHINPRSKEDYEFLTLEMKNLERLYIKDSALSRQPIPSASHLPKLRVVTIDRLPTLPPHAFFNLTELTLRNITSPISNLVDALQANQSLEKIKFFGLVVEADPHQRLVSLPNLKSLCISHSSPLIILRILSPLPTPSLVVVHDDTAGLETATIRGLLDPFLMFGPNDPVCTASMSFLPRKAFVIFHTSNGATVQFIVQPTPFGMPDVEQPPEFYSLLWDISQWGPFSGLHSMHLHTVPAATGPLYNDIISSLLSRAPRMTRLTFSGSTLLHHISDALNSVHPSGVICSELEFLGGTLRPDDAVVAGLRSLADAIKRGPSTIRKIALGVPISEEEVARLLAETDPLIQEIKSHGVHEFLLNPLTRWDKSEDVASFRV